MEFIIYELKAAVLLAVFYMFYRLLLSRDTFHRFNRVTLLVISLLSLVLPLCVITVHRTVEIPVWLLPMHGSRTETVVEEAVNEAGGWETAAVSLYIAGVMAVLAYTGFAVADVLRIILRSGVRDHPAVAGERDAVQCEPRSATCSVATEAVLSHTYHL